MSIPIIWYIFYSLVRIDVLARFRQTKFGAIWLLFTPIVSVIVYTYVFGSVFRFSWPNSKGGNVELALILYVGIMIFSIFSDTLNRSSSLMSQYKSYIVKVKFPLLLLPCIPSASILVTNLIGLVVIVFTSMVVFQSSSWWYLYLPLSIVPVFLISIAFSFIFSVTCVLNPDFKQIVPQLTLSLNFLTPVFYPLQQAPSWAQNILRFNPIASTIENWRSILIIGKIENPEQIFIDILLSAGFLMASILFFRSHMRKMAELI